MNTKINWKTGGPLGRACISLVVCLAAPFALGQTGLPGDVNLDGVINVLDVQSAVNMALGITESTPEADITDSGAVDVTDVQALTNTAIGVGGLRQDVGGFVSLDEKMADRGPVRVIAVSSDGRMAEAPVDPDTGAFSLLLSVKTAWTFGFVEETPEGPRALGSIDFPLIDTRTSKLPLPNLSVGEPLDIGVVEADWGALAPIDLRSLLASISEPLDTRDFDGNGLSDVLESLFLPLPTNIPGFAFAGLQDLDEDSFIGRIVHCMGDQLDQGLVPDISGIETDGVPVFLDPLFLCLSASIDQWLRDEITDPFIRALIPLYLNFFEAWLETQVHFWLITLDRPELIDTTGNGVPDYLEPYICNLPGSPSESDACLLDSNQNGIPDFLEDANGNGIPNILDPDARIPGDFDGDGIPDAFDIDIDNDGVPNYADADPYDPTVW